MSAYLKKSIGAIVMALAIGQPVDGFAQSTITWFETINVTYDSAFDLAIDIFDWAYDDYFAWDAGMWDSWSGGSGGGGEPPLHPSPCDDLRAFRPPNCPNPIPSPNGYGYGRDQYPGGSSLARLIYWIENASNSASAREFARAGLAHHTIDLSQAFIAGSVANERLLLSVQTACNLQHAHDQTINLLGQAMSAQERNCLEVLGQLQAEAGHQGFHGWFFEWIDREGIHLDDLSLNGIAVPETLIDWLAPSNSLRIRSNMIEADSRCARWWFDAQANHCIF